MLKRTSRRRFLQAAGAGVAAAAVAPRRVFAIGQPKRKPNVLLIMADEHNRAISGAYGNKIIRTPNIDSLAETGVTFESHYTNSPLCNPARQSFTAGKYPSRIGAWSLNSQVADPEIPSIARVMNAAGYESFLCGKQHYDYSRRYGFTEVGGNFNKWYLTGTARRVGVNDLTQKRLSGRFNGFHPGPNGSTVQHDRRVTAGMLEFLSKPRGGEKPFFLFCGYLAPHFPLVVPREYHERYVGKIEMPVIPAGFLEGMPLNYRLLRAGFEVMDVPDDVTRRGRELYYGLTNWLDDEIGKVLGALRANREMAENTIVIYTADHGENMGEHGMWWKNAMYEQSAGVPLIFSCPERWKAGQRRAGATSHVDLVRTLAEIAGGTCPEDWNGDSLLPWLDDGKKAWKDLAVSEYYAHFVASGYVMARSGKWKYTYHTPADKEHPAFRELYDLSADPMEFANVAGKAENAKVVEDLHARMLQEVGTHPDESELVARKALVTKYRRQDKPPPGADGAGD